MLVPRLAIRFRYCKYATVIPAINPVQEESLKENCLLVNVEDRVTGNASKRDCHRVGSNGELLLHRAFSVFLFNSRNELLLQKRSPTKITFPGYYTNTCCSHPLYDFEEERIEENALGIKVAAIRRLNYELGVPKSELTPKDIIFLSRIIYKSLGDGIWGEYELDYVLFIQKEITLKPNPEEISEVLYISRDKIEDFLKNLKDPVTPWFNLIVQNQLMFWWNNLKTLDKHIDQEKIHNFTNM